MSHPKILTSLHHRLLNSAWTRILVKMQETDEHHHANAVATGEAKDDGKTRANKVDSLRAAAQRCQEDCCRFIEGQVEKLEPQLATLGLRRRAKTPLVKRYWISNALVLDATPGLIADLAEREDVAYIREIELQEPLQPMAGGKLSHANTTWGLQKLRIPEIWARGFKGEGINVGHLDTGVDGTHPDLEGKIDSFVVVDLFGDIVPNSTPPFDTDQHGTHTAGTIVGGDTSGIAIGVAPDARLHSALVIEGGQALDRVLTGMEWAAEQGVDVLSMSVGFRPGDQFEDDFEEVVNNLVFLDIFPAIAIGNEGIHTTRAPGINAYSWSVGATDVRDRVATFSGGKVIRQRLDRIQPDIAAPGVDVYSAIPGNGYDFLSGTSMATPHVAGVVALLRQANPQASVSDLKQVIAETALDLGRHADDIRYGWGLIRPLEALETLLS